MWMELCCGLSVLKLATGDAASAARALEVPRPGAVEKKENKPISSKTFLSMNHMCAICQ